MPDFHWFWALKKQKNQNQKARHQHLQKKKKNNQSIKTPQNPEEEQPLRSELHVQVIAA